jgi:pimeloyl-ACP methyl ester carboxylesterase
MKRLLLSALFVAAAAVRADAQLKPVVFIHGFASTQSTWDNARYQLPLYYGVQNPTYATTSFFLSSITSQAIDVKNYMGGVGILGANPLVVAHSMGGIIARDLSHQTSLSGILTLGSPHQGAAIANSGGWMATRAADILALAGAIIVAQDCSIWDYQV